MARVTWQRIVVWIIVGGIGLALVVGGLVGIVAKNG